MNILLVVGIIILLGSVAGKICQKLNMPQVVGYIVLGLFLGVSFHGFLSGPIMDSFRPIISLALGIIGFMIGSEIRFDRFKRYSRSIYTILFIEAFLTFFLVAGVTTLITGKVYIGVILGALASATAPAATYSVIGEYKARGPVTTTVLSIVALDDALALIIYAFASTFARGMLVPESPGLLRAIWGPILQIAISVGIGAVAGYILFRTASRTRSRDRVLPLALGVVIMVVGLSIYFKVDPILASMVLGTVSANLQSTENREMFDVIKRFSLPIFIMFFVLVGARLDARILLNSTVLILAIVYILTRSAGKMLGAYIGGKLSKAGDTVTRYLGFCLFDQAGVAVGLAIAVFHMFSYMGSEASAAGLLIINLITGTTFILQLIAPSMIKLGLKKADEVNRNVTEEDIVETLNVGDVMDRETFTIKENNNLHEIIDIMKKSQGYHFPVISMKGDFLGIVSLGELRDVFYEEQMDQLVLAGDIYSELDTVAYAGQPLRDILDVFRSKNIDYIPVLEAEGTRKLVGQLEYRNLMDHLTRQVLLRQQELEV